MTDQTMFETWAQMLRPLFPAQAQFTFKVRRRSVCAVWPQAEGGRDPYPSTRSVVLAFSNLAWKGYRGARAARRARADQHLADLVRSSLAQVGGEAGVDFDTCADEVRITVASVDIFPPPGNSTRASGPSLSAG